MRIIAGKARSMPLKAPAGYDTRPTTDRIKETLFNMIRTEIYGCEFLDLFAGSGGIGLEAVSRGAKRAVFVENNRRAARCIQENINFTKFQDVCELMIMDAVSALCRMEGKYCFDIVFLDPPYGKGLEKQALRVFSESTLAHRDTLFIVEAKLGAEIPELVPEGYRLIKVKEYKTNKHLFLRGTSPRWEEV